MPSRRPHTKSRHGCLLCKARRVKCNLALPTCGSCAKRGQRCSLEHEMQWTADTSQPGLSAFSGPSSYSGGYRLSLFGIEERSINSPSLPPPLIHDELGLLQHFSSQVIPSFVERSDSLIWEAEICSIGTAPPYVIHCMLAVSAIHLAETSSLSELQVDHYRNLGIYHENIALSLIRPELNSISLDNCEAIYVSTALIFLSTIALPRLKKGSFIEGLVELSELAKGTLAVLRSSPRPLRGLYDIKPWDEPITLPKELLGPLESMKHLVDSLFFDSEKDAKKMVYLQAIDTLKQTLEAMFHNRSYSLIIFMFLALVDRQFIQLVVMKDFIALQILGHYGVCSCYIQSKWWARHWGHELIDAVLSILEEPEVWSSSATAALQVS